MNVYEYLRDNAWTWAGVVFIVLTLDGITMWLTLTVAVITIVLHWMLTQLTEGDSDEETN
jgi:hypothetical protein